MPIRFISHVYSLDYTFWSVPFKNLLPTVPQKDAWPRWRPKRLPLNVHESVKATLLSHPPKWSRMPHWHHRFGGKPYIYTKCHTCITCVWFEINLLTSVLGPLLFIIYTNDLPDCLDKTKSILFADDATGYISSHNISYLYTTMNDELKKLTDWFRTNKLSLSVYKANYMLFTQIHIKCTVLNKWRLMR